MASTTTLDQLFPGLATRVVAEDPSGRRAQALARFADLDLPGSRDEEWRQTPLKLLRSRRWSLSSLSSVEGTDVGRWAIEGVQAARIVFVGDRLDREASDLDSLGTDIVIADVPSEMAEQGDGFDALGAAAAPSTWEIVVAKGTARRALHLLFLSGVEGDSAAFPRLRLRVGAGAELEVIEDHVSVRPSTDLAVMRLDVELEANAGLYHERIARNSGEEIHLATMNVVQARDSRLRSYSVGLGGALVRHDVHVRLAGENAECELTGLVVAAGKQTFDNHSRIVHAASRTRSREHFRNVLDGEAHGVFAGRVVVDEGVVQTDAEQSNANLLLSDTATVDALPQLEIYNDDVKASHGSTIGQLDRDSLFYLRSRGIAESTARAMLTFGFANAVVESIPSEGVRELVRARVHAGLGQEVHG